MNKGVIFRAYPNKAQRELINKTLGCSRLVYNNMPITLRRKTIFDLKDMSH